MRSTEWARAAREYLVPKLPGAWGHRNALLYQQPIDWLLCYVVMQTRPGSRSFQMSADIQLLCEPAEYLIADLSLDKRATQLGRFRDLPEDLVLAEPVMAEIAGAISGEVVPFFARFGDLPTYAIAAELHAWTSNGLNCHFHERLFYSRLLLGDFPAALAAAEVAERTGRSDDREWAHDLADRVAAIATAARRDQAEAVALLKAQAAWSRTKLRLPLAGDRRGSPPY
ncbi:hypothetical protein [Actinoplanes sp. NPDC020271]|uniref:hypothetical protein n=1 Tax=Actinoplanes sp. NPDC020271 TaxID=3363896 RepID=UPI003790FC15